MNKRIKEILLWGGWLAIIFVFCKTKTFPVTIFWIFAWSFFIGILGSFFTRRKKSKKTVIRADPRFDTPQKAVAAAFNHQISSLLFLLNPFLTVQICLQSAGGIWEKFCGKPVFEAEKYAQKTNYILPVAGEWRVFNGGVTKETSHSWSIPSQRFAYDLVKFGGNGRSFDGDGCSLENYFCFDAPILAPADGVVVKVHDGIRDAPRVGTFWMDWLTRSLAGNFVLIKFAENEYGLLAHLKRGSIIVKPGQTVKQGQEIGRCGNSGNSTEPHLHFQFQNGKSFYFNSGLPVKFSGFWRNDGEQKSFMERDYISKGCFISSFELMGQSRIAH